MDRNYFFRTNELMCLISLVLVITLVTEYTDFHV